MTLQYQKRVRSLLTWALIADNNSLRFQTWNWKHSSMPFLTNPAKKYHSCLCIAQKPHRNKLEYSYSNLCSHISYDVTKWMYPVSDIPLAPTTIKYKNQTKIMVARIQRGLTDMVCFRWQKCYFARPCQGKK